MGLNTQPINCWNVGPTSCLIELFISVVLYCVYSYDFWPKSDKNFGPIFLKFQYHKYNDPQTIFQYKKKDDPSHIYSWTQILNFNYKCLIQIRKFKVKYSFRMLLILSIIGIVCAESIATNTTSNESFTDAVSSFGSQEWWLILAEQFRISKLVFQRPVFLLETVNKTQIFPKHGAQINPTVSAKRMDFFQMNW